jgi:predicted GNAT family N-acyltransferase
LTDFLCLAENAPPPKSVAGSPWFISILNCKRKNMDQQFIFREIISQPDLDQVFHSRYCVYSQSRMQSFLKQSEEELDIDSYDLHARHYGLFCKELLVGYIRIVQNRDIYKNVAVADFCALRGLQANNPCGDSQKETVDTPVYPFLTYPGAPDSVSAYYESQKSKVIVEIGRLILLPEYRKNHIVIKLIECAGIAAMDAIGHGEGVAVINCFRSHERAYNLFGFQRLPGLTEFNSLNLNQKGVALAMRLSTSLSLTDLPQRLRDRAEKLISLFTRNYHIGFTI